MSGVFRLLLLLSAFSLTACQTSPEFETDLDAVGNRYDIVIRSDVPLWMEDGTEAVAPRSFRNEDTFGCVSGLLTGHWKQTFALDASGYQDDPVWWHVGMGGAIHCTGWFKIGTVRDGDEILQTEAGYAIDLGHDAASGLDLYLWEIGVRTGSTYLLLSRREGDPENQFSVLNPSCSRGVEREAASSYSILRTDYCAIPDQDAMRATAREAALRPPAGLMQYIGPAADDPD